ncbi:MAG: molybdate ABC transporter substrate-binding protein [Desulfobacteraceae bacterium]|nr:molybdate ABC transporter substrate-binding protein [Desulfobacteraceae bacterium]
MSRRCAFRIRIILYLLTTCFCFAGIAAAEQELTVSAAASLTNGFQELGKKFEAANPGVRVVLNFAASGALMQQIQMGAPVDVFASADQKTMEDAWRKNLMVKESCRNFVSNRLVLIVPGGSRTAVADARDLGRKEISKIAIGKPETVPAGRYAQAALTKAGLWEALHPKFIYGDSVRQVLDYVSRGEVDAGFVFSTDAVVAKDRVRVVAVMELEIPIVYPIGVVAATQKKELAGRFIQFALSAEGQEALAKFGFGKP